MAAFRPFSDPVRSDPEGSLSLNRPCILQVPSPALRAHWLPARKARLHPRARGTRVQRQRVRGARAQAIAEHYHGSEREQLPAAVEAEMEQLRREADEQERRIGNKPHKVPPLPSLPPPSPLPCCPPGVREAVTGMRGASRGATTSGLLRWRCRPRAATAAQVRHAQGAAPAQPPAHQPLSLPHGRLALRVTRWTEACGGRGRVALGLGGFGKRGQGRR
jgi:hypothetical protein